MCRYQCPEGEGPDSTYSPVHLGEGPDSTYSPVHCPFSTTALTGVLVTAWELAQCGSLAAELTDGAAGEGWPRRGVASLIVPNAASRLSEQMLPCLFRKLPALHQRIGHPAHLADLPPSSSRGAPTGIESLFKLLKDVGGPQHWGAGVPACTNSDCSKQAACTTSRRDAYTTTSIRAIFAVALSTQHVAGLLAPACCTS